MKRLKQIFSMLLVVILLVNLVPADVFATPDEESDTSARNEMIIEGTNGFGNLLSEELEAYQEETACNGGYTVTDLVMEANKATITYDAAEEALLIAALYTEDGVQLLNSAQALVQPEEKKAELFFGGEIPEYFRAAAYLVNPHDFSPLCEEYETPMYTEAMQKLLDSTTDDYTAERVWNLDDDKTTNFGVYEESTIVIPVVEGINQVVSVDEETATYVIENADENITGLQKGDIFVYHFNEEEALFVKVDTMKVNGSTVTIKGADLEIEEVFSQLKLEAKGTTYDFTVDESTGDGSITYVGRVEDAPQTYLFGQDDPIEGTETQKDWIEFEIEKQLEEDEKGDSFKIYGTLKSCYEMEYSYYITHRIEYLSFEFDMELDAAIGVEGEIPFASAPFPFIGITPVPGLSVGIEMEATFKSTAKIETHFVGAIAVGVAYEDGNGFQNLSKTPLMESSLEAEGMLYLGIEITPKVRVLSGCLVEVGIPIEYGFELSAKYTEINGTTEDSDYRDEKHSCKKCINGGLTAVFSIGGEIQFLKCDWLTIKKSWDAEVPLFEFYYSIDYKQFGFGGCPYLTYRQTVVVEDADGKWVKDIPVHVEWRQDRGTTDEGGIVVFYLPKGEYKLLAEVGEETFEKSIQVESAQKIVFPLVPVDENAVGGGVFEGVDLEDITEINGEEMDSGECGKDSEETENITWTMYDNGLLVISGKGAMETVSDWGGNYKDYKNDIVKVIVSEGITHVSDSAFAEFENLIAVELPETLESIGRYTFSKCNKLKSIEIPEGVETVGEGAFCDCSNLISAKIPSSLTTLSMYMFQDCSRLSEVEISEGVTTISSCAFAYCDSLTEIEFPASVEWLGSLVLNYSYKLDGSPFIKPSRTVRFKGSAPEIADLAFNEVEVTICYPENDDSWTTAVKEEYEDHCTFARFIWMPYASMNVAEVKIDEPISTYAAFGGESATEIIDDRELQTASFKDLVPGGQYLFLVVKNTKEENLLSSDNLLYISQGMAAEDGTLQFEYQQKERTEVSYVFVCGPSENVGVERIYGSNRYETSLKIADAYKENIGVEKFESVIISCGTEFADALAGSYLASMKNAPILMYNNKPGKSNADTLAVYVKENLKANGTVYLLGGDKAVGNDIAQMLSEYQVKRLGGKNRYETNLMILEEAGVGDKDILVCTGLNFADSLSGSATQKPILLVNNKKEVLTDEQKQFLESLSGNKLYVVGGASAVSTQLEKQLEGYGEAERIGGANRYETSIMLAQKFFDKPAAMVLTYGKNFPDGLCGGLLAISKNAPLVLTLSNKYSVWAEDYAERYDVQSGAVLGGSGLIEDETVRNIFNMEDGENIVVKK